MKYAVGKIGKLLQLSAFAEGNDMVQTVRAVYSADRSCEIYCLHPPSKLDYM